MSYQAMKRHKCVLLTQRSPSEKPTYYIISIILHSGKGKITEISKDQWLLWVQGGEWMNEHTKEPQGAENPLYDNIMMPVIKHLLKPIDCAKPRGDHRLWVIMIC